MARVLSILISSQSKKKEPRYVCGPGSSFSIAILISSQSKKKEPRYVCGPGSSFSIATGYGLDALGIESWWGEIFRTCPDWPWGPPSLLYNGYRVFPGGEEWPGCDTDPSPPSSAVGHERVELYLYSPCGPYGLYRASVPVQGCTLLALSFYQMCMSE